MEVAVAQVAVGHGREAQALQALEELSQAAAGHHDVLAHLAGVALLQEGAGQAADAPDGLTLALIRGHLQANGQGTQQVQEGLEEGVRGAAPLVELEDRQGLARQAAGLLRAVGAQLSQHGGVEELEGAGQEPRREELPRQVQQVAPAARGQQQGGELPGRRREPQGGAHDEAEDALAAHQQLGQVRTGVGLDAGDAEGVELAIFQEGVHRQHPVPGHAVLAGVGSAGVGGQGAAQGAALPGVGVRRIEQAVGRGSGLHIPQQGAGGRVEAEVLGGHAQLAGPGGEVHHHAAGRGHAAAGLAGARAPGHQAEALGLGPPHQLAQRRGAVGLHCGQGQHAADVGLVPEVGLQVARVPDDRGLGKALQGVHGLSVTESRGLSRPGCRHARPAPLPRGCRASSCRRR